MSKALVIVESPAKMKTIQRYLGGDYIVESSVGHVKDLPKSSLGVQIEKNFQPEYEVIADKKKVMQKLKKAAKQVEHVYLALDPDREGEAIAWHIAEELRRSRGFKAEISRILFHEITKPAILDALGRPGELNQHRFDAQQARRILDRLVGYQISPVLWDKVRRGLSAGRVQSVAVRLIVDREEEVRVFNKEEFWSITTHLEGQKPPKFQSKLIRVDGEKVRITNEKDAMELTDYLKEQSFEVAKVQKKERKRRPVPPFITSKLQQEAARKLNFTARRTMQIAQQLYEGIELGDEGPTGLITYMRTDSTRLSQDAVSGVRDLIAERYGSEYLPEKPVTYAKKKRAQDAHEAIRPTFPKYDPEQIRGHLSKEQFKLYSLIWKRFVACQMKPAVFDQTSIDIEAGKALFRATGQVMRFDGFTRVYTEGKDDKNDGKEAQTDAEKTLESASKLPPLKEEEVLQVVEIVPQQHFTQPPPRFRESSLVKELEEKGIGRPSTYASILSVIQDKGYIEKRENRFFPTELGRLVTELLVEHFPDILDVTFTANMEANLDRVETDGQDWVEILRKFHDPFEKTLKRAKEEMRNVKREGQKTDVICSECGSHMVIKWGRNGQFLACSTYPDCKNTGDFERTLEGEIRMKEPEPDEEVDAQCPTCDAAMVLKKGRFGRFLACSRYPDCKTTSPYKIGVCCPREGCEDGDLVEKRSRKGKTFYSCSNYPKCDYALWDKPLQEGCPSCGHPFLVNVEKRRKNQTPGIQCPECGFRKEDEESEETADV